VVEWLNSGSVADAAAEIDNSSLEADEKTFLWGMMDSKQRKSLKDEFKRQRDELTAKAQSDAIAKTKVDTQDLITDAQKKRLEARIGEVGVTRDSVKQYCFATFSKEHFADLTKDEYQTLDEALETMALASQA
jgi:hypothetical protein